MQIRTFVVASLTVLSTTFALAACSSDDDGSTGGGNQSGKVAPAKASDFARVFASEYCDLTAYCCSSKGRTYEASSCVDSLASIYSMVFSEAKYDQSKAQACLDMLASAKGYYKNQCPGEADGPMESQGDDTCGALMAIGDSDTGAGNKKPGETCTDSSDCAPSSKGEVWCVFSFESGDNGPIEHRSCQVQVPGKVGDAPCRDSSDGAPLSEVFSCDQAQGLRCDASSNACAALSKSGESCTFDIDCEATLYCSQGSCVARKDVGDDCAAFVGPACKEELFCDETSSKCKALLASGEACSTDQECKSGNCDSGHCKSDDDFLLDFACPAK